MDSLSAKLSRNIYVLWSLAGCVSCGVLRTAYFALCHSLLSYGIMFWGQAADAHRVFALQRRAVRIIAGLSYREHCKESFRTLKILTFSSTFTLHSTHSLHVKTNLHKYKTGSDFHVYDTRNRECLNIPYFRLTKCQNGPNFLAIKYFNALPVNVKNLPLPTFKKRIKDFLISEAFYSCEEFLKCNKTF